MNYYFRKSHTSFVGVLKITVNVNVGQELFMQGGGDNLLGSLCSETKDQIKSLNAHLAQTSQFSMLITTLTLTNAVTHFPPLPKPSSQQ